MYNTEEIHITAILNERLDTYVDAISKGKRLDGKFSLQHCEELEDWTLSYETIGDVHMATITKDGKKIIAIAQEYKNKPSSLIVEDHLTEDANVILTSLKGKLSSIQNDPDIILSGYKNGGAFAEILSCQFHVRCVSFYSPGIKKLMPILKTMHHFSGITEENNKIIGIDGEPNDYNTRYGSICSKIRLPIPFYDAACAAEARVFVKDFLISTTFISAAMTALPYGGLVKQLGVLFPFLINSSTVNLTLIESFVEMTNLNFHAKRIQAILDKNDIKQHDMKSFLDIIESAADENMDLKYQIFTPFDWPIYKKNAAQRGMEYILDPRCITEFIYLIREELKYLTKEHTDNAIFHEYINAAKNKQLLKLTEQSPLNHLQQINELFKHYKVEEVDDEYQLVSHEAAAGCEAKLNTIASNSSATTKTVAVGWFASLVNAGMYYMPGTSHHISNRHR